MLDDHSSPQAAYNSAAGLPAIPVARPSVIIERFRPVSGVRGTLRCYVDVKIVADYVTVHWVAVHQSGSHAWVRLPSASAERRPMYFYLPLVYLDALGQRGFEEAVIRAVKASYPGVLAGGEAAS